MTNVWWNIQTFIVWLYSQLFFHNICSSLGVCYQPDVQAPCVGWPKKYLGISHDFTFRWMHKPAAPLRDVWTVLLVHDDDDQHRTFASQERCREETIGLNMGMIVGSISLNQPEHGLKTTNRNQGDIVWGNQTIQFDVLSIGVITFWSVDI